MQLVKRNEVGQYWDDHVPHTIIFDAPLTLANKVKAASLAGGRVQGTGPLADWMRKCCPQTDVDLDRVRRGRAYSSRRRALLARPVHIEDRGVGKLRNDRHARRSFH